MRSAPLVFALLASCAHAGPPGGTPSLPPPPPLVLEGSTLPAGDVLEARLDEEISTASSEIGEEVEATLLTQVTDRAGTRLLPAGTKIVLRVEDLAPSHGAGVARVEAAPVAVRVPCRGQPTEAAVDGTLKSEVEQFMGEAEPERAREGGIGGMIVGGIFMGLPGAELGGGLSAAGGVGKTIAKRRVDAHIDAGTRVGIELDAPLDLGRLACRRAETAQESPEPPRPRL